MRATVSVTLGLALASFMSVTAAQPLRDPTRPPGDAVVNTVAGTNASRARSGMVLQTVLISTDRTTAVISGRVVSVGDTISGLKLVEIREGEVVLKGSKGSRTLRLFPAVNKSDSRVADMSAQERGLE